MKRVQVQFSEDQHRALKVLAATAERPVSALVREAVDAWITDQERQIPIDKAAAASVAEYHDRFLNVVDLVSISEISRRAGRSTNTIQSWRRRYQGFPKPVAQLAAGPIWDWDAVARWILHRSAGQARRMANVPGFELVEQGLADLDAGRESVEGRLLRSASTRLAAVGINVPGGPLDDPTSVLYGLVVDRVGEARAHSHYNALRRRLSSFLHAAVPIRAPAT